MVLKLRDNVDADAAAGHSPARAGPITLLVSGLEYIGASLRPSSC